MTTNEKFDYPIRVLFLCTGNSARSQIAEALLRKKGGDRFVVGSAGAEPAREVSKEAIDLLRGLGIDWADRRPKGFDAILGEEWDMVITLCDRAKESCPSLPSRPVTAHWGVPDPMEIDHPARRSAAFQHALQSLSRRIDLMLALRIENLERLVLEQRLRAIPRPAEASSRSRTKRRHGNLQSRHEIRTHLRHPRKSPRPRSGAAGYRCPLP